MEQTLVEQKKVRKIVGTKINKIVMTGFKSFASRTELLFGDKFNVVLGPNGSGKSNILDAVCFVLGKSSAKGLRAEKAAHLIYNGGKTKQPMKYAEVSIYFDNSQKTFPLDDKEIKITRTVKSDGQSKYRINDKTKTRTEIIDLLSAAKIDPDGYNIILQGDIVRFVKMSSVSRREIIEEIAGIGIYEEKKQKALRELERVDERLREAEIVLNERSSYLKTLKADRDQAMKYKELNDKINSSRATYLDIQIKKKEKQQQDYDRINSEEQQRAQKLLEEIEKLKQLVEEKKKKISEISRVIEEQGEESQVKLNKKIESLKTETITARAKIDSLSSEIARVEERKKNLMESFGEIESKVKETKQDIDRLKKEKETLEKEQKEVEQKLQAFRKKHSLDKAGDIDKEVEKIDAVIEEKQKKIQQLREEQQALLREKDRIEFKLQSIDNVIDKVAEAEKENKSQIESLKQKRTEFKRAAVELNKRLNDDSSLSAQLSNARRKQQSLMEELSRLKIKVASAREKAAANNAVKKILEQKKKFRGIYGTVSEIGEVEPRYTQALEAAAGSKINYVIVDNDRTAASCIKYLRENKLGTATFLPLNKIKSVKRNDNGLLKHNGVHGMAVDLVKCDNRFKKIFSYVFGNTIVVDNIDVARRIGVGKARMATLQGDLTELSGAMRGGYRQKPQGTFQIKGIDKEVDKTEACIAEIDSVIDKLESKKEENEKAISKLREKKAALEGEIIKLEKTLHLESEDLDASKKQKSLLKDQLKDLDKRIGSMQSKISGVNRELANAKIKKQELRSKISQLRSPTLLAELTAFEQKKKDTQEKLINLNAEIRNSETRISTVFNPEKERIEKVIKQIEKEQENFQKAIRHLKESISVKEKELKEKEKKAQQFYEKFKASFNERSKIQELIQKDEEKIYKKEEAVRNIERKMNDAAVHIVELKTSLSDLYEEFKKYGKVKLAKNKSEEELKKEISEFERMMDQMGSVNLRALEIYDSVEKEYNILLEKKDKLKKEKEDVLMMMNEIERNKKKLFMETFNTINENFSEIFSNLSAKGKAYLEIEDPKDPFVGGVNIKVRLTGTRYLDVKSLSGGEQTLTSLAFIFAIQEHEPASFYVLDEIEAALDRKNAEKLAKLIEKYSERAQYIVISHNDAIISNAEILYGVSMDEHAMSKVVSMKA